jgi:hypothetical protein
MHSLTASILMNWPKSTMNSGNTPDIFIEDRKSTMNFFEGNKTLMI